MPIKPWTSEQIDQWLLENSLPACVGRSDWRKIVRYGLEGVLQQRIEQALRTNGPAGAYGVINATINEARRIQVLVGGHHDGERLPTPVRIVLAIPEGPPPSDVVQA